MILRAGTVCSPKCSLGTLWRCCQRVVGTLAELAGDSGTVSNFSQTPRSSVTPAEHVGEHSDGVGSCRAALGSVGTLKGGAGCCGEAGNLPTQAVSSSASASRIRLGVQCFGGRVIEGLSLVVGDLFVALQLRAQCQRRGFGSRRLVVREVGAPLGDRGFGFGQGGACVAEPQRLPA